MNIAIKDGIASVASSAGVMIVDTGTDCDNLSHQRPKLSGL